MKKIYVPLLVSVSSIASAYVHFTTERSFTGTADNNPHEYVVDNDLATLLHWQNGAPTQQQLLDRVAREAQYWNINARAAVGLVVKNDMGSFADLINPTCSGSLSTSCQSTMTDGKNGVYTRAFMADEGGNARVVFKTAADPGPNEVDIIINRDITWLFLSNPVDQFGLQTSSVFFSFPRVVAHEMGHALDLTHPQNNPTLPDPWCSQTGTGAPSPLMCSSLGVTQPDGFLAGRRWDRQAPDDGEGVRASYGANNYSLRFAEGAISSGGTVTWSEGLRASLQAASHRPRVSCQHDPNFSIPDCVVASTVSTTTEIARPPLTLSSWFYNSNGWTRQSQVTSNVNATNHEVDVAFRGTTASSAGGAVAVLIPALTRGKIKWIKWDLATGSTLLSGMIKESTGQDAETREPPRVAYHKGIDRYVVMYTTPDRLLRFSVSTDNTGTNWYNAKGATFTDIARNPNGHFDLSCPQHTSSDQNCHIIFNDGRFDNEDLTGNDERRSNRSTHCSFSITTPVTFTVGALTCNVTGFGDPIQVSLSDYGDLRFGSTYAGNGLLYSVSRAHVLEESATAEIFTTSITSSFASGTNTVALVTNPLNKASSADQFGWGGMSCDWAPATGKFFCPYLEGP
jgi:hypothetical protein